MIKHLKDKVSAALQKQRSRLYDKMIDHVSMDELKDAREAFLHIEGLDKAQEIVLKELNLFEEENES